jgi:hypothetical protein
VVHHISTASLVLGMAMPCMHLMMPTTASAHQKSGQRPNRVLRMEVLRMVHAMIVLVCAEPPLAPETVVGCFGGQQNTPLTPVMN